MGGTEETGFRFIRTPHFPEKPREKGLTMVLEYGLGLPYQQGLIDAAGGFLDMVKFGTGLARILPKEILVQKIALYRQNGIHCFPGGQFFELAHLQGRADAFIEEVKSVGFSHLEISDNCIDLTHPQKAAYIRRGVDLGLTVLGESGKKLTASSAEQLIEDVQNCREAGAWKVFVEAAELIDNGVLNLDLVAELKRAADTDDLIFEIPGQWMEGMTFSTQYHFWKLLIRHIGPHVNLANIPAEELLRLTLLRLGLGADTTLETGAFVMTKKGLLV